MAQQLQASTYDSTRLILLGKTGVGKSATGNTILGEKVFRSEPSTESVTDQSEKAECTRRRHHMLVVDTPGIFDTNKSMLHTKEEIMSAITLCKPGPHAFLIVINIGRLTPEENEAIQRVKSLFGQRMFQYAVIVFTRAEELEKANKPLKEYVQEAKSEDLKQLVQMCDSRCIAVNNLNELDSQASACMFDQVLNMVERIKVKNESENEEPYYTVLMLEEHNRYLQESRQQRLQEQQQQLLQKEKELAAVEQSVVRQVLKKYGEIIQFKQEFKGVLEGWLRCRQEVIAQLQSIVTKGNVRFKTISLQDPESQHGTKGFRRNLIRIMPHASVFRRIMAVYAKLLSSIFLLKEHHILEDEDVEKLQYLIETDANQTSILQYTLCGLEVMKAEFRVPYKLKEYTNDFTNSLRKCPPLRLTEDEVTKTSDEVPDLCSQVCCYTSPDFCSEHDHPPLCIQVTHFLENLSITKVKSKADLSVRVNYLCNILQKDLDIKSFLHKHWFGHQ